jgi:hypothetical protein
MGKDCKDCLPCKEGLPCEGDQPKIHRFRSEGMINPKFIALPTLVVIAVLNLLYLVRTWIGLNFRIQ